MKIAIIGAGNVGGALARRWATAGHTIILGMRNPRSDAAKELSNFNHNISAEVIEIAVERSDVVLFSTPSDAAVEIAKGISMLRNKIVIDATNAAFKKPEPYKTAFEGIKKESGCSNIVKCFNTTGYENMLEPKYGNELVDMFAAGSSAKAKQVAEQLSKDAGFGKCYDFGGDDKVELLEQFALSWINLAIFQKYGRNIAFKILCR